MTKGETTRMMILSRAAPVFNRLGFAGASLSDIMQATGLEKGGIYNHFRSKEELAIQAFDYAINEVGRIMIEHMRVHETSFDRLLALIHFFNDYYDHPPVAGGCPLLNTAIESDDAHPILLEHARRGMDRMRGLFQGVIQKGTRDGTIRPDVNSEEAGALIVTALEGGMVMSKLYGTSEHINRAVMFMDGYVRANLQP
jgi:AcrR family transcriptional regulator